LIHCLNARMVQGGRINDANFRDQSHVQ